MTIDALARREGVRVEKVQLKSAVARCSVAGQRVLLAKPLTYMNLCGESIGKLAKFYKVWPHFSPSLVLMLLLRIGKMVVIQLSGGLTSQTHNSNELPVDMLGGTIIITTKMWLEYK